MMATYYPKSLANDMAWATECNLATLSDLLSVKRTSKSKITRQTNICLKMLETCLEHRALITWGHAWRDHFGRVQEILEAADASNLSDAFAAWVKTKG